MMATVAEKHALRARVLTRAAAAFALAALTVELGCAPEPRVSPLFGGDPLIPPLSVYVETPDLDERLRAVEAETAKHGLTMTFEARGVLPKAAGQVVVRAYEGRDALGRKTHAVRAATARGIILAAGPRAYPDPDLMTAREEATELVRALVPNESGSGGAYQAATDLNGDGYPDIALRNEAGVLEIWKLGPIGGSRYEVRMEELPTTAIDADGDGQIDFAGVSAGAKEDVIAPELIDFAVFDGAAYSNKTAGAKGAHAKRAKALAAMMGKRAEGAPGAGAGTSTAPVSDEVRLRRALSLAWHSILSGAPREEALKKLDAEPVPPALRPELDRHRSRIEQIGQRR